jgi:hypothetical protein
MKIFVVGSSKNTFLPLNDIRTKFLVDVPHDGSNIDFLNPWYCELTGLYYMWQHCTDDIIGLEHYRRYFVNSDNMLLSSAEILNMLTNTDMLVREYVFPEDRPNALAHFSAERLPFLLRFVDSFNLDEKNFFMDRLSNSRRFAQCNMFIGKRSIIDTYCRWLLKYASKIPFDDMIRSPRIIGYLAEFVFGFWLDYMGYKTKWCPSITV